jgi:hypothetical protein
MTAVTATLAVHVAAGVVALAAGYVALYAEKGARLHVRGGTVFAYAMTVMGLTASVVAAARSITGSIIGGLVAAYFAVTGVTALRPQTPRSRRVDAALMLVALAAGLTMIASGAETLAAGRWARNGVPVPMTLFLGTVTLLSAASDVRVLRAGPPAGAARLTRHLLRMCFALWIAAGSFFLGQADEFPEALRVPALLALPVLAPLVAMAYWTWRLRARRRARGAVRVAGAV